MLILYKIRKDTMTATFRVGKTGGFYRAHLPLPVLDTPTDNPFDPRLKDLRLRMRKIVSDFIGPKKPQDSSTPTPTPDQAV